MIKRIVISAGPNGAGKSTFAREFLPNEAGCPSFVNFNIVARRRGAVPAFPRRRRVLAPVDHAADEQQSLTWTQAGRTEPPPGVSCRHAQVYSPHVVPRFVAVSKPRLIS